MQQTLLKKGGIRISAIVLIAALLVMVVTSVVGRSIATSAGSVKTQDITFTTDVGAESHAKLYIPETATASAPSGRPRLQAGEEVPHLTVKAEGLQDAGHMA